MNCPEHLVIGSRFLYVWMYWRDVPRERIPLKVWLNPLRYEVQFIAGRHRLKINREGLAASRVPHAFWKLWCRLFGHKQEDTGWKCYCTRCHKNLDAAPNQRGGDL